MSTQEVREEVLLNMRCIVKGYHLCRFQANVCEVFTASKRRGERGNAFKVGNHCGQFGHLQGPVGKNGKKLAFSKENGYMWTERCSKRKKRLLFSCNVQSIKIKCVNN